MIDFNNLNEQQIDAINYIEGPCLVMAGAGSGKTKVLTTRVINLIKNGIKDYNILAITFTNKAAKEMRDRIYGMYGEVRSFIGTFHSFGLRIIRENHEKCGLDNSFSIIDSDDQLSIIKKILKSMNIDPKKISPYLIRNKISLIKNEMLSDSEIERVFNTAIDEIIVDIYRKYENTLAESNSIDFDDLLIKPVKLLMDNDEILDKYQERYQYILVDEYQDTNPVQYKLCKLLASKYRNLFVVGDMNQSIYAFRQADYKNILNFERDYKEAKIVKLEQNYRSTNNILNAANCVIKNNNTRKELKLWSNNGDGAKVKYMRAYDERHEVSLIISEINKLLLDKYKRSDIAILYRTNGQARVIEEGMLNANMPYNIIGSFAFYNRKEIKDLLAYLKLINNTRDNISLLRIINVPKRGIGPGAVQKIEELANTNLSSLYDALSTPKEKDFKNIIEDLIEYRLEHTLTELIDKVLDISGMKEELEEDKSLESELRLENLMEFKSITQEFENNSGSVDLGDFLDEISLVADKENQDNETEKVTLMTMHSAKGLEFPIVFLVGMEEGIFPHANAMFETEDMEEERRLCYVGITRAKEILYLTNAKRRMLYGKDTMNMPSRFIDEINEEYLESIGTNDAFETKRIDSSKMYKTEENTDDIKKGDTINHESFGIGIVLSEKNGLVEVAFKSGVRTLMKNHKSIRKV